MQRIEAAFVFLWEVYSRACRPGRASLFQRSIYSSRFVLIVSHPKSSSRRELVMLFTFVLPSGSSEFRKGMGRVYRCRKANSSFLSLWREKRGAVIDCKDIDSSSYSRVALVSASEGKGWRVSADQPVLNPEFLMGWSLPIEKRGREARKGRGTTMSFKPQLSLSLSLYIYIQPIPGLFVTTNRPPRGFRVETPFLG